MKRFIQRFADKVIGVLSGFDRLVFRGTLRAVAFVDGLKRVLWKRQVLLKDFGDWAQSLTRTVIEASRAEAGRKERPIRYLPSGGTDKEALARKIAREDGITEGLIAVLESVEPCRTYDIYRNKQTKRLDLVSRIRKCKYLYHYFIDPVFGFMNARIQTWLPFSVQICLNGREWLSREMDRAGIGYRRRENTFVQIDDVPGAQKLLDRQLKVRWPIQLSRLARLLNPAHGKMFRGLDLEYYWSVYQSEWATDIMFESATALAQIYPDLVQYGIRNFSSPDVMRFLAQKPHWNLKKEVKTSFKDRAEGVRIKHWVGENSVKLYDKEGSVLRTETTINDPYGFKVFRAKEGEPQGELSYRPLRAGIADLHRRAQVSQASNDRYLEALAAVDPATPLGELMNPVVRPTSYGGKRVRGLRPWSPEDLALLKAVNRGEFSINGFRNRDLAPLLFEGDPASPEDKRRRSGRVSRQLRMLRAHGLIRKVASAYRYVLTDKGRQTINAILSAHAVTLEQLRKAAA